MLYKNNKRKLRAIARMIIVGYLFYISSLVVFAFADPVKVDAPITIEAEVKQEKELIDTPLQFSDLEYIQSYNKVQCLELLNKVNINIEQILNALDNEENYTDNAKHVMSHEYNRLLFIKSQIELDINNYTKWEQEHYYAAKTFEFLLQHGFTKEVACGIIGNMMIETSGGSLDLKPNVYNPTGKYYGLCQWNKGYGIHGASFERQLEFLISNIEREFTVFGHCYKAGFTYEDFLSMTDTAEAALAFAEVYERCYSSSFGLRKQAAQEAYSYFSLNK